MSHFNEMAQTWDEPGKVKMMHDLSTKTIAKLNLSRKMDIMDFGCGTGLFGLEFAEYVKTLTGIDNSDGMLDVFKKKTQGFENYQAINIDLEKERLDKKFDLIVSSMAFHHIEEPGKLLSKLKTMLKPKGQIAIVDLDKEDGTFHPDNQGMGVKHFGFSKNELQQWASNNDMQLNHYIINEMAKNEKTYSQFLAIFSV